MKIKAGLVSLLLVLLFSACTKNPKTNNQQIVTKSFHKDSLIEPLVIPIGNPEVVDAGKPTVVIAVKPVSFPINTNITRAGQIVSIQSGTPRKLTPGIDSIALPVKTNAKGKVVLSKQPVPVAALTPRTKDDATANIKYLDMDQGMNSNNVNAILEDKIGNLWFATNGGGVSKYDGKSFWHYTEKEGLNNNNVSCMLQDIDGNLWFGTTGGGVCKYDGNSFTHFTEKEGLSNNSVTCIIEDLSGNIWFGTNGGGVNKYDGDKMFCYTKKNGLCDNIVLSMFIDEIGNIWFGTLYGGVDKFDGRTFYNYSEQQGLSKNWVTCISEDKAGNLLFGNRNGGVDKFDRHSFTNYSKNNGLVSNIVTCVNEDRAGNIWCGTQDAGISKYDGKSFVQYSEKEGLNDTKVNCMLEDRNGNIWVGTANGGVNKLEPNSFINYTNKDGLINNKITSIAQDGQSNIWFGSFGGLSKYDGTSIYTYTEKEGLNSVNINALFADREGNIWIGTNERGVDKYNGKSFTYYTQKEGLINNCISCITEDGDGNMWFATLGVGVNKFDGKTFTYYTEKDGLSSNYVTYMIKDRHNNLWFATQTRGVTKYDGKSFTRYGKKQGLSSNKISYIVEDKAGNIWFGTNGEGVIKYDGKSFINYSEKDGLSNNTIRGLIADKEGKLWISTVKGLNIISKNDKINNTSTPSIKVLTKDEGLKDNRFIQQSILLDSVGCAWWGGNKSLTTLNLNKYSFPQDPPTIQLNSIDLEQNIIDYNWLKDTLKKGGEIAIGDEKNTKQLNGIKFKDVAPFYNYPRNLELPYYLNHLTFHFSAIDWQAPHKLKYVYTLEGLDKDWSLETEANIADYRNLSPGKYTFKVNATGIAGKYCDGFQYSFIIRSPFWQSWWFRTLAGIVIIVLLYSLFLSRTAFLRRRQVVLQQLIKERTADVVQQKQEVEKRNEIIEDKQKEILASINYAQRIQRSILPPLIDVLEVLPKSFILFKPKDIVSGDFYWFSETESKILIAAADCTGHGVPGAFMSAICSEKLNEAVSQTDDVSLILQIVNIRMKKVLRQYGKEDLTHDGMDIAICAFDKKSNKMEYAGANRPLWIIRNNATITEEIQANKVSIGGFTDNAQLFTKHSVVLEKNDTIYISTDGFADQFGPQDKKLMTKKFKELLVSIQEKTMEEQKIYLDFFIENWRGDMEQTDDILVIGIRA